MNPDLVAFLTSWSWQPGIVLSLLVGLALYWIGWVRLRRRGRGQAAPPMWRAWAYTAGLLTIGLALLSPIDVFDDLLFFMHMIQHMLLLMVAPVFIWLGRPLLPVLWALPRGVRRDVGLLLAPRGVLHRVFDVLTNSLVAALVYLIVIAVWHLPALYNAAEGGTLVHYLEHFTFLGAGLIYWWPLIHPAGGKRRLQYDALYIMASGLEGGFIGGIFSVANEPLYSFYADAPRLWGISAVADQQLAGAVMWAVGGLFSATVFFTLFIQAALQEERALNQQAADGRSTGV